MLLGIRPHPHKLDYGFKSYQNYHYRLLVVVTVAVEVLIYMKSSIALPPAESVFVCLALALKQFQLFYRLILLYGPDMLFPTPQILT